MKKAFARIVLYLCVVFTLMGAVRVVFAFFGFGDGTMSRAANATLGKVTFVVLIGSFGFVEPIRKLLAKRFSKVSGRYLI